MKKLFALIMLVSSLSVFAESKMVCENSYDNSVRIEVSFSKGVLTQITYEGETQWQFDTSSDDQMRASVDFSLSIIRTLAQVANVSSGSYNLAMATVVTGKKPNQTISDMFDVIADDGAGIVLVEFMKDGKKVGTSIFAGWAGFYRCL